MTGSIRITFLSFNPDPSYLKLWQAKLASLSRNEPVRRLD